MKNIFLLFAFYCIALGPIQGQTVNYSEHIAPIIYKHCTSCHRPGEIAPFSLTNYDQVKSWSGLITYVTEIKYMPPWKADPAFQHYQKENYLEDSEIQLIADWVEQGTPQGNPALEPPLPVFPNGSQIGNPDLVLSFAQSYLHQGTGVDEYRYFVIPTGLTEDKDLVALEIRPGNKKIMHHCLVWGDTTGTAASDDAKTLEYGYESGSSTNLDEINNQLPGYVPGQKPVLYTNGIASKLYKGTDLKLQVHYAPTNADETDSTSINLFFAKQPATRYVQNYVMLPLPNILTNGPFIIFPNTVKEFHGQIPIPEDVSMLGIAPHMHKLGQHWLVYAVTPNNDTINLVKINEWDFNWQGAYYFKQLIKIPKNSILHAYAEYDNTSANVNNPNDPPKAISWGEKTSDEMYYLPLLYLNYQPGDENIVFDETTAIEDLPFYQVNDQLYPVAPNPASGMVQVGFTLRNGQSISLTLLNMDGKVVQQIVKKQFHQAGLHTRQLDVSQLPSGMYALVLES
ncbi:MAG: T9SS type A sorting domain-containing protein, partial [Saprospiraceae bacterium]